MYQKLDVLLEDKLLSEYLDWNTERLYTSKQANGKEEDEAFFEGLRDALSEDVETAEDEICQRRHEEGLSQGERDRQSHGQQQFLYVQDQCWYSYDGKNRQWQEEPSEEGSFYEKRRAKWRGESFHKPEQRFFVCVERRFYQYTLSNQKWHAQWPSFARWHAMFFTWGKERQWRVSDEVVAFAERGLESSPAAQHEVKTAAQESFQSESHQLWLQEG